MAESAALIQEMKADIVDINLGCPVKKVVKQGGGSNLLRDLPLLERIFKSVRRAVSIPLTVKIRSGWDRDSTNALEVLKLAEDCGIDGLAIHGRARCDLFAGKADWSIIARVKAAARIPVVGNGDVFSPPDAKRMFLETGVDGVMIGRGVLANPWLIRQCHDYLEGNSIVPVTPREQADFIIRFLEKVQDETPPPIALGKMKKMGGYLSKGIHGGAHLRELMHASRSTGEFLAVTEDFLREAAAK
jgi:nifR3 family TIM-barrel protein